MKTIDEIRRENAIALADLAGGKAAFSEIIDRETTQVSRFMGRNYSKKIGDALARHIELCFNKERGWLDQNWADKIVGGCAKDCRVSAEHRVALYSVQQLGRHDQSLSTVICPFPHGPSTFAFTIEGMSGSPTPMQSQYGRAYPVGSVVFVDPGLAGQVRSGDPVAAILTGDDTLCFRILYREGGAEMLMPLNSQFPAVSQAYRIVGKVIGAVLP